MRRIALGNTGVTVSELSLGCMLMGTLTDEPTSYRMLDSYLDAGGDFLDTANCYAWWHSRQSLGGESEALLGRWLARSGRRDDVFLATKATAQPSDLSRVWGEGDEPDWKLARRLFDGAGAATLHRAIDESLRRLGTDHVDLFYVHVDDRGTPLEETLQALDEIVRSGKARYIGWSNVRSWRLERVRQLAAANGWVAPVAVQQLHSLLRPAPGIDNIGTINDEMLDYLREHDDLTLMAYSPILKGLYDDAERREKHWLWPTYDTPHARDRLAAVAKVAAELGATGNQVALAWLLAQREPQMVPIIGARTWHQFESYLPALTLTLSPTHLDTLTS